MIFKTKNNELAIFGNTLDEVKNKYTGFITAFKTNGLKGENGALSTLFGNKKQNVIDSSLISQFEKFKEEFNNSSMSAEALAEKIGIVDERIVNYAKTCKNGELTTKGFTTSLDEMSVGAKAGRVALQGLAMVGNMLAMVLVSKLVEGIYQLATYSSTLADKASEVGSAFKETESDIASYKVKIEDLQATINDSSSSYSDVTQARKDLMTIQDELINKYGSEEGAIKNITDAIKGQTSALDELTNTEYQKMVNDFNKTDFLGTIQNGFKGSNFQQMLDNMEGGKYRVTFAITGDKDFNKLLQDKFGAQLTGDRDMMITGNLQEVYDKLLEIQELSKQYDTGNFFNLLSGAITTAEDNLKDYKDIYNAYILHDKILNGNNDDFAKYYKEANDEYEKYKESVEKDGIDSETAKKNAQEYVDTVNQAMDKALTNGETGISNYFRTMHEDLINEVNSEDFEINFKANTDGIKDDLKNAVKEFSSGDDILSYNFDSATNDQRTAYAILTQYAKDYHMEVADLVALLEKLGIIASQTKNDLYNKLVPSENNGTAGVSATMSNNASGVDPNETKKWIESISDEDATLIQDNMPAFNKALEEQKQGLNGASFSAQNYQNALDNMKQSLDDAANKTSVSSFSEAWSGAPDDLQTKLKELAEQGKLTKEEFENTDSENYFDGLGISADEAVNKINQLVSASTQLQSMSAQISKMSDMLADKKNGTVASASDLAGFDVEVRGLDSWSEFEKVMGSSKSSMEECQKAANALATEWVNSGNFLANLTEENKDYYVTQLQNMGIENAEEVVTQELTRQKALLTAQAEYETLATEYNSDAKNENNQVTTDLTNATISEIAEIIAEGNATSDTQKAMAEFALSKFDVNNEKIDTSSDVKSIIAIANAAGASAEYVDALRIALENLVKAEKGKKQTSSLPTAGIGAAMANMAAEENVKYNKNAVAEALENAKKSIKGNKLKASDYIVKPTGSSNYKGGSSGGKSKSGSGKDKTNDTKQTIDWIERKLDVLQKKIDATKAKFENLFTLKDKKNNLNEQIKLTNSLLNTTNKAAERYKKAANGVKLSDSLKKKVQNGAYDITEYGDKTAQNIQKYQNYIDKYNELIKQADTLNTDIRNLKSERYQLYIDDADARTNRYETLMDGTTSTGKRISYLKKSKKTISTSYKNKIKQAINDGNYVEASTLRAEWKNALKDNTISQYQERADKADKKAAKSQALAALDEGNYKKQNKHLESQKKSLRESYNWQIKIAKKKGDTLEVARLQAEKEKELRDLTKEEFDNIANTYDNQVGLTNNKIKAFQDQISLLEAKGQKIGSALYTKQMSLNNINEKKLIAEREKLIEKLNEIPKGTDDWYKAQDTLFSVESELVNVQIENANLQKSINQLKFDRFDDLLNKLNDIVDETDFLIDMLDSDNFFDDNGKITDDGITAMGMYAQKYDVYLAEAQKYKEQMAELERDYQGGDVDPETYEAKMREYKNGQQDMIKSANDAKKSLISLVKEGLDAQNKALEEAIQKQKDLLSEQQKARNLNQTLEDQNKRIARLKKQLSVLDADSSEEARKTKRELQSELDDLLKEQENTLYEQSIEDQEKNLDELLENSEKQASDYLKNSEAVFVDALNYVNANTETVSKNLEKISSDLGYDISTNITDAWKDGGKAVDAYESILQGNIPKITTQIGLITSAWNEACEAAEKAAQAIVDATTDDYLEHTTIGANGNNNGNGSSSETKTSLSDIKNFITKNAKETKRKKSYYAPLNQYIYDKTKGKVLSKENERKLAKLLNVDIKTDLTGDKGRDELAKIRDALKLAGYSKGGVISELSDAIRLNGDTVLVSAKPGERMLTEQQNGYWEKWTQSLPNLMNLTDIIKPNVNIPTAIPTVNREQSPVYNIDSSITVDGIATNEIVKDMANVAKKQAENVISEINRRTYAKGVRHK